MTVHKKWISILSATLFLASPIVLAERAFAEAKVGVSAAVRGNVFVKSGGQKEERKARAEQSIFLQDEVLTKQQSALQILLIDQSMFTIGENCEMIIDKFVYDPDKNLGEMSGTILKGAFRFMSGRIGKANPKNAKIKTAAATIGIRGTMLEGVVGPDALKLVESLGRSTAGADPQQAILVVLRGPGRGTNAITKTGIIDVGNERGSKTISAANFGVFVPGPGQKPVGPFRITESVLGYFDFYLRSVPNGPTYGGDSNQSGAQASGQDAFNVPADFPPLNELFQDELFDNQFEEFKDDNNNCYPYCNDVTGFPSRD